MLDRLVLPALAKALAPLGRSLAGLGLKPELLILLGLALGLGAAVLAGAGIFMAGLALFLASRLLDGLANSAAREAGITPFGRYLDLYAPWVSFSAIALGFGFLGDGTALIAAILVFSLLAWGATTLAYAGVARGLKIKTDASGRPVLDFFSNLIGVSELSVGFILMFLLPDFFPAIAVVLALVIFVVTILRVIKARAVFG